jgi:hypothetical protein
MSWATARAELDARLLTLPSLGTSAIGWPNEKLETQTALYYKVAFIPATVEPELYGGDHERGIYQVSVFVPVGEGIGSAVTAGQAVIDHFKRQNLNGVSCGVPPLATPIQEPNWWHTPVSIPFTVL